MSFKPLRSLSLRSGLSLLLGAVVLTVMLSSYFYYLIIDEQVTQADRQLQQLVATVENSAAVAAYLDNEELATEVVRGLVSNDIVAAASLQSESGMRVVAGDISSFEEQRQQLFRLQSPFMPGESAGHITLQPNQQLIADNAQEVARVYVATLAAHSLALTILAIVIVHWRLARPVNALARRVHEIEPGSSHRIQPLQGGHQSDELGQLVDDINYLLEATQHTLDGERRLRQYVESVERRFRLIFEHASCGIVLLDTQGQVLLSNAAFSRLLGLESVEAAQQSNFIHLFDDASQVRQLLQHATTERSPISTDLQLSGTRAGSARWLHALFSSVHNENDEALVECILYDISERTRREQQTRAEAERDPLTQLFNRRAGERRLQEVLEQARQQQEMYALMLIDLDSFKPINDTYGHEAGDRVLVAIANRLTQSLRKQDVVVRWGGDEFVVMAFVGQEAEAVTRVAGKLLQQIDQPIDLGGHEGRVGASIGVVVFPQHGHKLVDLVAKADRTMYQAKERGRNQYLLYQPEPASLRRS